MQANFYRLSGLLALSMFPWSANAQVSSNAAPAEHAALCYIANDHLANVLPKGDAGIPGLRSTAKKWYAALSSVAPESKIAVLLSNAELELASRMSVVPNPSNDALRTVFRTAVEECEKQSGSPAEKSTNG